MALYRIRTDLFLEEVREGVMLTCLCLGGPHDTGDIFSIALSHQSVKACNQALSQEGGSWQIADKSLRLTNRGDEVTLRFEMQGPPFESRQLILRGSESKALKQAFARCCQRADALPSSEATDTGV